jgi:hypothetical protein
MTLDEVGRPFAGSMGTIGISNEINADFGTDRRTITSAPPAEMFSAVANSSESLPFAFRERTKMGMESCNRAHFRSSLLGTRLFNAFDTLNPLNSRILGAKHEVLGTIPDDLHKCRAVWGIPDNPAPDLGMYE